MLPVTVTDAQQPSNLTRWAVYIDGELDDGLIAYVRPKANSENDERTIVLDPKQGMYLLIR